MLTTSELQDMYRLMALITATSNRACAEVKAGSLQSAFYPVRGLEGVCAALGVAKQPGDQLVSTYRSLGDALAWGSDLRRVIAEIYGRADGVCGGKGGPMHLHDTSVGYMTSTGIVGSGIPIAVGLGIAAQLDGPNSNGTGRAVVTTFGDGATSIGAFHEGMNMAALWKLPVLFLCQNNQWGEHTPIAEYAGSTDLAGRAASYGMTAVKVDGFDPVATADVLREALERARSDGGPTFVEAMTYRLTGHSGSADYSYMPAEELAAALERDPVPSFRRAMLTSGQISEADLDSIEASVAATVDDAFTFAQASPEVEGHLRYRDVFAEGASLAGMGVRA
ncbi:thiamine pyrophosphate-dependent dehydrogenase E1 component subunit alpha [Sporichthya sp.]|uniref:thiamine pyrophosphate-dependent dehydrogenase E1 component subunit alpha n=1 Tax=Sporichthya sp. TaxID=65475 RepID=UPI0017FE9AC3|nr:thiamine pyrophosphate-dependent dehydrogenase E1 component subunit alpha [Sporichthya sp.]MBA3743316.1 thiamine pyrophosphate-dependent dehydrogenase E1 component subunit alpha [Sporichthya sp.]